MTHTIDQKSKTGYTKATQSLSAMQKLKFGMVCWGVQSWGQANSFKTNGYTQKYKEAKQAMHTGLFIYGLAITLFVASLAIKKYWG